MTPEQKTKAYDEAIKKAKALYGLSEPMSGCNVILETIFPELKESEDEKVRKELIKHLKEGAEGYEPAGGSSDYQRWLAWLEKQTKQNPAWSEEDEDMIQALDACINAAIKSGMNYISFDSKSILIGKVKNWLKSLRPQNKWKPSDEQMKALKEACDEHWESDGLDPLYTLYQDLKKLREE